MKTTRPSLSDLSARVRRAQYEAIEARTMFEATGADKHLRAYRKALDTAVDIQIEIDTRIGA